MGWGLKVTHSLSVLYHGQPILMFCLDFENNAYQALNYHISQSDIQIVNFKSRV